MYALAIIFSIVLAAGSAFSGVGKIRRDPRIMEPLKTVGVAENQVPLLGGLLLAGAVGLIIGIFWKPLGIITAAALFVYFIGAVLAHVRVKDTKNLAAPAGFLLVALLTLIFRSIA